MTRKYLISVEMRVKEPRMYAKNSCECKLWPIELIKLKLDLWEYQRNVENCCAHVTHRVMSVETYHLRWKLR